jgi:hypothetical protein
MNRRPGARSWAAWLCIAAALAFAGPARAGEAGAADGAAKARREHVAQALAALDGELKRYGDGTWEGWIRKLKPFREDLKKAQAEKRPAKHEFVYKGGDFSLLMLDTLDGAPAGKRPFETILHLDRQLKARGVDLILMPIPDKLSAYPDFLATDVPCDRQVCVAVKHLFKKLLENDVEIIDLFAAFHEFRRKDQDAHHLFYGKTDSHWRSQGAQVAAERIAERLKRYDVVQKNLAAGNPYTTEPFRRDPGQPKEDDVLLIRAGGGAKYGDVGNSPFILTCDSYGYYNSHLGSHVTAQVTRHTATPMTLLFKLGLSGNMPVELARSDRGGGYLKGRRAIVWTFVSRFFIESAWPKVDLP